MLLQVSLACTVISTLRKLAASTGQLSAPAVGLVSVVAAGGGAWLLARAVVVEGPRIRAAAWLLVAVGFVSTLVGWVFFGPLFSDTWDGFRARRGGASRRTRLAFTLVWAVFIWVGLLAVALVNATLLDEGVARLPADQTVPHGSALWAQAFETEAVAPLAGVPVLDIPDTLRWHAPRRTLQFAEC